MLYPKKVKFRKWQSNRKSLENITPDTRGLDVSFGSYGLKATSAGRIRSNQIEAARKVISRTITKSGRLWIRIFPDRPFTAKPAEIGMGKGKGDPQGYCVDIRPGRILFEVEAATPEIAQEALRKGGTKLPVKTRIVGR
ncbi:MAG: 50S ribosomal protein L16 [Patescibacteria group bacterium]|nr:50S ribosomal protein L16 [Patescibacteria group bacterium]